MPLSQVLRRLALQEAKALHANKTTTEQDVVQIKTATPKAKEFIEALMEASFYDPASYSFSVRHPEAIYASELPEKETVPIIRPTTDVYGTYGSFLRLQSALC